MKKLGKKLIAWIIAVLMIIPPGGGAVLTTAFGFDNSVELTVKADEIIAALEKHLPNLKGEKNLDAALAAIDEGDAVEDTTSIYVESIPTKTIKDENGEITEVTKDTAKKTSGSFSVDSELAEFAESSLVLPLEEENSVIMRKKLLTQLEGKWLVKTAEGENWQAIITIDPENAELGVYIINTGEQKIDFTFKVTDKSGKVIDIENTKAVIQKAVQKTLTEDELAQYKNGGNIEVLSITALSGDVEDEAESKTKKAEPAQEAEDTSEAETAANDTGDKQDEPAAETETPEEVSAEEAGSEDAAVTSEIELPESVGYLGIEEADGATPTDKKYAEAADKTAEVVVVEEQAGDAKPQGKALAIPVPGMSVAFTGIVVPFGGNAITVTFNPNNGEEFFTTIVDENGYCQVPSAPELPAGMVSFRGWYEIGAQDDNPFDFGEKITEDLTLEARFSELYLIKYKNADGSVYETREVEPNSKIPRPDESFDLPDKSRIAYWYIEGDINQTMVDFDTYQADADITLVPKLLGHYVVVFVSQGSYVESESVEIGGKATKPLSDPTRSGYTFKHWSTTNDGPAYNFDTPLAADLTLYAVWEAKTVNYTVVYWLEKPNMGPAVVSNNRDNFQYYETDTTAREATAGTIINNKDQLTGLKTIPYAYVSHVATTEILGNGLSIVNVYYKRTVYTVEFDLSGNTGAKMVFSDDPEMTTEDNRGKTYEGVNYSFKAKYSQDIEFFWPSNWNTEITRTDSPNAFCYWVPGNWISKRYTLNEELIPSNLTNAGQPIGTITFTPIYAAVFDKYVEYWIEALPHEDTANAELRPNEPEGIYYLKSDHHSQIVKSSSGVIAKSIEGTQKSLSEGNGSESNPYKFYYTRNRKTLSFDNRDGQIISTPGVMFEAKLSYYKPATDPTRDGYDFKGWYYEADGKTPVDFDTAIMPNNELTIYACWEPNDIKVNFYDGIRSQGYLETQGVAKNDSLDPDKSPYKLGDTVEDKGEFVCWQYVVNGIVIDFKYEMAIANDMNLYAKWKIDDFELKYEKGTDATGTAPTDDDRYALGTNARVKDKGSIAPPVGQLFIGWQKDGARLYYPSSLIKMNGTTTLTAVYGNEQDYLKLTFNPNNPAFNNDVVWNVKAGQEVELYDGGAWVSPTHQVTGWATTPTGPKVYDINEAYTMAAADTTLYAVWAERDVTINFIAESGGYFTPSGSTVTRKVAKNLPWSSVNVPTPAPYNGYYFIGWTPQLPADTDLVTADATYRASFGLKTNITIKPGSASKVYDGTPLTEQGVSISSGSLKAGHKLSAITSGTITNAGETNNSIDSWIVTDTAGNNVSDQYTVTAVTSKLIVTQRPVTLKPADVRREYTGTLITVDAPPIVRDGTLAAGDKLAALTGTGSGTATGSYLITFGSYTTYIVDAAGNDMTGNYNITLAAGTLTIYSTSTPGGGDGGTDKPDVDRPSNKTISDNKTPLANIPKTIMDDEVPKTNLPKTGGGSRVEAIQIVLPQKAKEEDEE